MKYDRRNYARVPSESLISVDRVDDSSLLAQALDLSVKGLRFQVMGLTLEPEELLRVQLTLEDRTVTVVGRAVRVAAIDAFTQEVAVCFVQVDPDTQRFLERQLAESLLTEDEIEAGLSALEPHGEHGSRPEDS